MDSEHATRYTTEHVRIHLINGVYLRISCQRGKINFTLNDRRAYPRKCQRELYIRALMCCKVNEANAFLRVKWNCKSYRKYPMSGHAFSHFLSSRARVQKHTQTRERAHIYFSSCHRFPTSRLPPSKRARVDVQIFISVLFRFSPVVSCLRLLGCCSLYARFSFARP